jgi:CheY-like chemotaxis protein
MSSGLLKGKQILAVDDERDVLDTIRDELEDYGAQVDRASSYEEGLQKIASLTYDLIVLDIMGVQGFELLEYAVGRKIPAVMLTAHSLSPESLKRSIELGARAYLPKDQLGQVAPFLEDVLYLGYRSGWKSLFSRLGNSFGKRFGPGWRKTEKEFWQKFEQDTEIHEATILHS